MTEVARRRAGVFVATLSLIGAAMVAVPATAASAVTPSAAAPNAGVDLSAYHLVGRYELPEPTRTAAPAGSLLAQEASSVTYDWDTGTLFVVGDGGTSVVQVSTTGRLIDSETLAKGSSPQGTEFYDTEAVSYVGDGRFVLGEERYQQVNLFTYTPGATLTRADVQTVKLGATIGNTGVEGFAYDPQSSTAGALGFIGVKEIDPKGVFQTDIDFAAGTASNANTSGEPANLFDPTLVPTDDFSDVYPLSNQPALAGTPQAGNLLIISQQSGTIVNVDRSGDVASSLTIEDAGAPLSVPDETHEGITMDRDGNIYTVNENGGGDSSHPQLWVYSPTQAPAPRVAVTEVDPAGSGTSYGADWFELSNTGSTDIDLSNWKMDDSSDSFGSAVPLRGLATLPAGKSAVFFENTDATADASLIAKFSQAWYGSDTPPDGFLSGFYGGSGVGLSTSGDGVNLFDGSGNHLTGVSFGAAPASATFDNSARLGSVAGPVAISQAARDAVDGAYVSPGGETGSPEGLTPNGGGTTPPPANSVIVSEAAPWASGNTAYGADWFELSNTGTNDIDLSNWKMDDNSDSPGSAVPLLGVATLPAGASAIFFEDTDVTDASFEAGFAQAWFGTSTLPAGFLIGHYGGGGVGLSTGGDSIDIFDAANNRVTGIAFGASDSSSPYSTFDNSAGAGSTSLPLPVVTALSAVGVNGARLSADGQEIGSPGAVTAVAPPAPSVRITEIAPWGSGDAAYAADWFELTNTGATAVDLSGWSMDDNSNSAANAVPLLGLGSLPAGESAVFFEDTDGTDATIEAAFAQAWFSKNALPAGFLIGHYGGSGVGLSTGGDAVNVFDGGGNRVTGVAFGASPTTAPYATFDNAAGLGSTSLPLPLVSALSAVGANGAFLGADGQEIGSPGSIVTVAPAPSVAITEVSPWSSGDAPYAADWFELTNTGTDDIDLSGWKMDDNSNSAANAVPLLGLGSLPAGTSAVFFEDTDGSDATIQAGFAQAWFGTPTLPDGFLIGHYGGSGVGLSTGGDAVNVFDASGDRVTGVAFGASPASAPYATFDNTAGLGSATLPLPLVSTLSVPGTNGAFLGADGREIGSPAGAAAPQPKDTTPPVIVVSAKPAPNAAGWNNSSVTVSYSCTDAGSGVDESASSLADDVLTASGTATGSCVDKAGNSTSASYTAKIDTVAPTVKFSGNTDSYGIYDTVRISCAASDQLSGVVASSCPAASGTAWSLGAGAHTLSGSATDAAGNVGTATTSFTVTVTGRDLSKLTTDWVQSSAKYKSSNILAKLVVSALVTVAANLLLDFPAHTNPSAKAARVSAYAVALKALVSAGLLSSAQATTLTGLAGGI